MVLGPITSKCYPVDRSERFSNWVVRAMSRDSFGKLRKDLDEYFSDGAKARAFFDSLLVGDDVEHAEILVIAEYMVDRWGDEHLGEMLRLSGETLLAARDRAREEKESA